MDAKTGAVAGLSIVIVTSAIGVAVTWMSTRQHIASQDPSSAPTPAVQAPALPSVPLRNDPPPEPTPIERLAAQIMGESSAASVANWPMVTPRSDTWGMLKRNPASMFGEPACFRGTVLEIHQISPELSWMRVGMDRLGADVVSVTGYQVPANVIADRRVEVCGRWMDSYTYESQAGWTITLPGMMSAFVERL